MKRGVLLVFLWLAGCGESPTPEPEPVDETTGVRAIGAGESDTLPTAHRDGSVLRVGPHFVEVLFFEDGSLHAWMLGPDAPRPSLLEMHAEATTADGVRGLSLAWNPETARFEGRTDAGAGVGRFALRLEVDGETHRGAVDPLPFRASEQSDAPAVVAAPVAAPTARPTGRTGTSPVRTPTPADEAPSTTEPPAAPEAQTPEPTATPEPAPEPAPEPSPTPEATPTPETPPSGGRRVRPAPL